MKGLPVLIATVVVAAAMSAMAPARAATKGDSPAAGGAHSFDFLVGEWRAHHRRLLPDGSKWVEFDGTMTNRKLLDGSVNVEEHALTSQADGPYRAVGLRAFDAKTGDWSIWWLDGRYPSNPMGKGVVGHFDKDGTGRFYADYEQNGKPMRGRFLWSEITPTSARWEQSSSADGGKTWQPNWIFTLTRDTKKEAEGRAPAPRADVHDFDFLVGDWQIHHRYLRAKDEWTEMEGTVINRPLMGSSANIEEHTFNGAKGTTYGLALRSYDAKKSQWSIWWLDSRDPSRNLDPPMQGHWESGVGKFYGTASLNDKTLPARFIWSVLSPTAARWEQAYSYDDGKTWETNWVMELKRAASESRECWRRDCVPCPRRGAGRRRSGDC
jgi:hypothetical protein